MMPLLRVLPVAVRQQHEEADAEQRQDGEEDLPLHEEDGAHGADGERAAEDEDHQEAAVAPVSGILGVLHAGRLLPVSPDSLG